MKLIKELSDTKKEVIIAFCSSDMILFKSAGATHCCTGKFFNLRRFTKSRFDASEKGGGQLPYWFEHSLFAFLRESDILRLQKSKYVSLLGTNHSTNFWSQKILKNLKTSNPKAWIAYGWRQYLSWFGRTETELSNDNRIQTARDWLKKAEQNWVVLDENDILFEEPRNNGHWLRPWRQALIDFLH
jgi:hypothetical protein